MNGQICLTRSNWQEESRELGDDVRGILLPESVTADRCKCKRPPESDRPSWKLSEGRLKLSDLLKPIDWAACLGLPDAANILGTCKIIGELVMKLQLELK